MRGSFYTGFTVYSHDCDFLNGQASSPENLINCCMRKVRRSLIRGKIPLSFQLFYVAEPVAEQAG